MKPTDTLDNSGLAERLRIARTAAGLTQEAAAGAVGVARTTVVAIERGDRRVRPAELIEFARIYGTSVSSLVRPSAIHVEVQAQFRASDASPRARGEAIGKLVQLATAYAELERAVERPLRPFIPPQYPATRGNVLAQGEDAAMQLRGLLGLGTAPVGDILRVAELQLGFRVFVRPLDSKVAGVYAYHAELGACVLVNSTHPRQRRAWTLAHEIGHFMSNRDAAEVVSTKAEENDDPFADAFAGAFLLPPPSLRRRFGEIGASGGKFSPRDLVLLAHEHQVSVEALCRWLERLRLLPRQTYEALRARGFNAEHVRGVLGDQPEEANVPVPPRLLMIAAEAHQRGIVTEGQLVDMLGIDRLAVRELLDGIPGGTFDDAT